MASKAKVAVAVIFAFLLTVPALPSLGQTHASDQQTILKTTTMYIVFTGGQMTILRPELEFNSTTTVQFYPNGNTTTTVDVCRIADPSARFLDSLSEFPANASVVVFGTKCEGFGIILSVNGVARNQTPYVLSYMVGKTKVTVYAKPEIPTSCSVGGCAFAFALGDDLGKIVQVYGGKVVLP